MVENNEEAYRSFFYNEVNRTSVVNVTNGTEMKRTNLARRQHALQSYTHRDHAQDGRPLIPEDRSTYLKCDVSPLNTVMLWLRARHT